MADIYMTWDRNFADFVNLIYNSVITKDGQAKTILNIFIPINIASGDGPIIAPWIREHVCLTDAAGAPEASLIAYIMQNFLTSQCLNVKSHERRTVLLVQNKAGQHEELVSILNRIEHVSRKYDVRIFRIKDVQSNRILVQPRINHGSNRRSKNYSIIADRSYHDYVVDEFDFDQTSRKSDYMEGMCNHEGDYSREGLRYNCEHCATEIINEQRGVASHGVKPMRRSWPCSGRRPLIRKKKIDDDMCQICMSKFQERQQHRSTNFVPFEQFFTATPKPTIGYPSNNEITACNCFENGNLYLCEVCLATHLLGFSPSTGRSENLAKEKFGTTLIKEKDSLKKSPKLKDIRSESAPPLFVCPKLKNENAVVMKEFDSAMEDGRHGSQVVSPLSDVQQPLFQSDQEFLGDPSLSRLSSRNDVKTIEQQDEFQRGEIGSPRTNSSENSINFIKDDSGDFEQELQHIIESEKNKSRNSERAYSGRERDEGLKLFSSKSCQTRLDSRGQDTQIGKTGLESYADQSNFIDNLQAQQKQTEEIKPMTSVATSPVLDCIQAPIEKSSTVMGSTSRTEARSSLKFDYEVFNDHNDKTIANKGVLFDGKKTLEFAKKNGKQMISPRNGEFSCQFCPGRKFKSHSVWKVHMKNCHKKCNCPCGSYFETRNDYLIHFYQQFPLACFLERKCPDRFRSLYYQAIHHRDKHFCDTPFFCVVCFNDEENTESRKKVGFKDIRSLRIHAESFEHDPKSMFLISSVSENDDSSLPWTMKCTGINFS